MPSARIRFSPFLLRPRKSFCFWRRPCRRCLCCPLGCCSFYGSTTSLDDCVLHYIVNTCSACRPVPVELHSENCIPLSGELFVLGVRTLVPVVCTAASALVILHQGFSRKCLMPYWHIFRIAPCCHQIHTKSGPMITHYGSMGSRTVYLPT